MVVPPERSGMALRAALRAQAGPGIFGRPGTSTGTRPGSRSGVLSGWAALAGGEGLQEAVPTADMSRAAPPATAGDTKTVVVVPVVRVVPVAV